MRIYLDTLFHDAGVVELRHISNAGRVTSGLFNDPYRLIGAARQRASDGNLYTILNAPKLRVVHNVMGSRALRDQDIAFITRLPFDFDPCRPADTSSTDAELAAAIAVRDHFVEVMRGRGWALPLVAMSGNGAHAQYRCRLPANSETREAFVALYRGLHEEFGDDAVAFDRTVRNPSRIFRLYGSINRKGLSSADRPHRQASCQLPERWRQVTQRQIIALADFYDRQLPRVVTQPGGPVSGDGDYSTLDIVGWFKSKGLYKRPSQDGGGKHYVTCPWADEHSSADHPARTDTVVWEAQGRWPNFHCSHAHCEGRGIREVIYLLGDADEYCAQAWEADR